MTARYIFAARDKQGQTFLMRAAYRGRYPFVGFLLEQEAYIYNRQTIMLDVDFAGNTPLHHALKDIDTADKKTREGKVVAARRLIIAGANLAVENNFGERPTDYVTAEIAREYGLPYSAPHKPVKGARIRVPMARPLT